VICPPVPSSRSYLTELERRLGVGRVAAEPEAVEEIIRLCGRLPLALAIVAARAAAHSDFTLASIATDLRRTRGRLDAFGTVGVVADVRTVFSWSYHHLTPQACRLFRLLSLQPATDITVTASASLLGDAPETASRLMAELTSTALITEHQPGRYALHELIRVYAAELSDSTDTDADRHEALARLLDHYLQPRYPAELKPHREPAARTVR
jgi:hypothetical protein